MFNRDWVSTRKLYVGFSYKEYLELRRFYFAGIKSSYLQVFLEKCVPKICNKFTVEHPAGLFAHWKCYLQIPLTNSHIDWFHFIMAVSKLKYMKCLNRLTCLIHQDGKREQQCEYCELNLTFHAFYSYVPFIYSLKT